MPQVKRTIADAKWQLPPSNLSLARNEVHLWRATIDVPSPLVSSIWKMLSADETDRANRFVFERDCHRFVVARGFLRMILGWYIHRRADELQFDYTKHGKPCLAEPYADTDLKFNVSHSTNFALYGLTLGREIGVDLEQVRSDIEIEQIASRMFSTNEVRQLRSLPSDDVRVWAFFNCWTRKEAFLKAKGSGLFFPLDQFSVTLLPGDPASLVETQWNMYEMQRWSLEAIDVAQGYAAAIAVEGNNWSLHQWEANEEIFGI
ncbi:MAG: 4'-phosphopantetheinyl transferase family protein [Pyrinomonadaceae bacterium]